MEGQGDGEGEEAEQEEERGQGIGVIRTTACNWHSCASIAHRSLHHSPPYNPSLVERMSFISYLDQLRLQRLVELHVCVGVRGSVVELRHAVPRLPVDPKEGEGAALLRFSKQQQRVKDTGMEWRGDETMIL